MKRIGVYLALMIVVVMTAMPVVSAFTIYSYTSTPNLVYGTTWNTQFQNNQEYFDALYHYNGPYDVPTMQLINGVQFYFTVNETQKYVQLTMIANQWNATVYKDGIPLAWQTYDMGFTETTFTYQDTIATRYIHLDENYVIIVASTGQTATDALDKLVNGDRMSAADDYHFAIMVARSDSIIIPSQWMLPTPSATVYSLGMGVIAFLAIICFSAFACFLYKRQWFQFDIFVMSFATGIAVFIWVLVFPTFMLIFSAGALTISIYKGWYN